MLTTEDIENYFRANDDQLPEYQLKNKQKIEDNVRPSEYTSSDDESELISFIKTRRMKHIINTEAFNERKKRQDKLINSDELGSSHGDDSSRVNYEECNTNLADVGASSSGCGSCRKDSKNLTNDKKNSELDAYSMREAIKRTKDLFEQFLESYCENDDGILDDFHSDDGTPRSPVTCTKTQEKINKHRLSKKIGFLNEIISLTERKQLKRKIYMEILNEKKK